MKRKYCISILLSMLLTTMYSYANSKTSGIAIQKTYESYPLQKVISLAKKHDHNAQYDLSERYSKGIGGVKKDMQKAIHWALLSAEQNNSGALNSLGYFHHEGLGFPKNATLAFTYYKKGAEQGNRISIYNVGYCYMMGCAERIDQAKAARLFQIASDLGYVPAKVRLGYAYDEGAGVKKDKYKAYTLYKEAALAGEPSGQFNLSLLYYMGEGIPENNTFALMWRYIAAKNGNRRALFKSDALNYLLSHMTKKEILKAKKLAKICYTSHYKECPF